MEHIMCPFSQICDRQIRFINLNLSLLQISETTAPPQKRAVPLICASAVQPGEPAPGLPAFYGYDSITATPDTFP